MIFILKNKSGYRLTIPTLAGRLFIPNGQQIHTDFLLPLTKATLNCKCEYKIFAEKSFDEQKQVALTIISAKFFNV